MQLLSQESCFKMEIKVSPWGQLTAAWKKNRNRGRKKYFVFRDVYAGFKTGFTPSQYNFVCKTNIFCSKTPFWKSLLKVKISVPKRLFAKAKFYVRENLFGKSWYFCSCCLFEHVHYKIKKLLSKKRFYKMSNHC